MNRKLNNLDIYLSPLQIQIQWKNLFCMLYQNQLSIKTKRSFILKTGILKCFRLEDLLEKERNISIELRYGRVYLAREKKNKHIVAIKALSIK